MTQFFIPELYRSLYGYTAKHSFVAGNSLPGHTDSFLDNGPEFSVDDAAKKNYLGVEMIMPLKLSLPPSAVPGGTETTMWEMPVEALVSVKGAQIRKDRYPMKGNGSGSHKERWSMDDYSITIKGLLINFEGDSYPEEDSQNLRAICEYGQASVECALFRIWGIERIVIDDWDIPFTPGSSLQEYTISAKSDKLFDSLLTDL